MTAPFYNWLRDRSAGVLFHPTSLPGDFGVGCFSQEAFSFVDFLRAGKIRYWQVCPLGPTGYGDSPYQCFSSFAGNPYLIDLLDLSEHGLLKPDALGPLLFLDSNRVDYGALYELKWPILFQACQGFRKLPKKKHPYGDFEKYLEENRHWLDAYAYFHALKQSHDGAPWYQWPESERTFELARKSVKDSEVLERVQDHRILQYLFDGQWRRLKDYASRRGVRIIGDVPIYAAADSADVWSHPDIFQLDAESGRLLEVAGVPPDYFSETGQLWGNPLYNWKALKASGYQWWLDRLGRNLELYDVVRIDHFRGFHDYWSIPSDAPDARSGRWLKGPDLDFLKAVKSAYPKARLIAEDLGDLSEGVYKLRDAAGLPGMAILQFAFGGESDNLYLPHNHTANTVVYPGTHDNNTTRGWYEGLDEKTADHVRRYFRISGEEIAWDFVRAAYRSPARMAVIPMQDLLNLDESARLNLPGEAEGNWRWRCELNALDRLRKSSGAYLVELAQLYGRS